MKNKKILLWGLLIVSILSISLFIGTIQKEQKTPIIEKVIINEPTKEEVTGIDINKIKNDHQNEDIIGYIVIPEVVSYPVLQKDNNNYYLNHDINNNQNIKGSIFMDYRVSFNDRKILIYGHSGKEQDLPFLQLNKYSEESFFQENKIIYLYSVDKIYTYEIFSSYVETADFDYVNINSFNGLTWFEHLLKLKEKSNYQTDVALTKNSKVLILQTCSMNQEIQSSGGKYQLIIGKLTATQDNKY